QTCGDEDALRIAKVKVAMAHSVIAEGNIVAVGNQGFLPLANRQRNKIIGLALQRGRGSARHGRNHSLQVGFGDRDLTGNRIADTIWRLRDGRPANDFRWSVSNRGRGLRHEPYSSAP